MFDIVMFPLELAALREVRADVVSHARGDVLEVGVGTGANLGYYPWSAITSYRGLDLSIRDRPMDFPIPSWVDARFVAGRAEELPFPDASFDTVVSTLVFCTVAEPQTGFAELHRVLRPGGRLLYVEHVHSPRPRLARVMTRVNPVWKRLSAGCNITRRTVETIRSSGFEVERDSARGDGLLRYGIALRP